MNWYTPNDLAHILQVTPRTIQRWARERRIPHMRVGTRTIRFTHEQLAEIQATYTRAPEVAIEVDVPNPRYQPRAVVVPMRRDGAA